MTWDELWQAYAQALQLRGRSPVTVRGYGRCWRAFVRQAESWEISGPLEVLPSHLERYGAFLQSRPGLSESSARAGLRSVLLALGWAARQGLLLVDPGREISLRKPARPVQALLSVEQVYQLLEAPLLGTFAVRLRDKAVLELLYGTGVRAGELVGLNLDDLDLAQSLLTVRRGKSRCSRRLPLGECSRTALNLYLELARPRLAHPRERALFVSHHGTRLKASMLATTLNRYAVRLNLPAVSPHALRRAFASHMLENGANLADLKAFLGHADVRSTQVYTLLRPVDLEKAYKASHPRALSKSRLKLESEEPTP